MAPKWAPRTLPRMYHFLGGRRRAAIVLAGTLTGSLLTFGVVSTGAAAQAPPSSPSSSPSAPAHYRGSATWSQSWVCGQPAAGDAACDAILLTPDSTTASAVANATDPSTTPGCAFTPVATQNGYGPCDLQSAYNLLTASATDGSSRTVAIVDAFNDPDAASDLSTYRANYGLPACTTTSGCFKQVSQTGTTTLPRNNGSWSQEISLDLDMVSATCPLCDIVLVEARSASQANLAAAANEASKLGVVAISNSYGGSESTREASYDTDYHHAGIAVTASAGDGDYGVEYPAASPFVTSVGGTTLSTAVNARGWTETVWGPTTGGVADEGTGSGCSTVEPQPKWQTALGLPAGCSKRIVADVSAVANPYTGVAVYDSFAYQGSSGWLVFGGTSVASPLVASVYALSGVTTGSGASIAYKHPSDLFDVTSGTNSSSGCTPAYLCTAEVGYDGPTGLGTPDGTGAF